MLEKLEKYFTPNDFKELEVALRNINVNEDAIINYIKKHNYRTDDYCSKYIMRNIIDEVKNKHNFILSITYNNGDDPEFDNPLKDYITLKQWNYFKNEYDSKGLEMNLSKVIDFCYKVSLRVDGDKEKDNPRYYFGALLKNLDGFIKHEETINYCVNDIREFFDANALYNKIESVYKCSPSCCFYIEEYISYCYDTDKSITNDYLKRCYDIVIERLKKLDKITDKDVFNQIVIVLDRKDHKAILENVKQSYEKCKNHINIETKTDASKIGKSF